MIATSNRQLRAAALILGFVALTGCQTLPDTDASDERRQRAARPAAEAPVADPDAAQERRRTKAEAAAADADLWAAIRADFALQHEFDHPRVQAELEAITRYPSHFMHMREQLELYLPHVFEQVQARGLPSELALLPILESGMNPHAQALSGPAGLWQLIPATGDRLGLPRNWWYDGRRDPAQSTRAALDYLEYLHSRFGDWRLAIVAYNVGEGTVTRAMQGRSNPDDFWSLRLPAAGMVFVPKLLAFAEIVADPARHGMALPELRTSPTFTTLPTGGQIEISRAAEALGIDEETLYLLNPGLNRTATPPEGPHQLHVPPALADRARTWLASIESEQRVAWDRIEVRRGDSLSVIASRHGTDVRTLRQINNLPDDRLRAGQSLFVPGPSAGAVRRMGPPPPRRRDLRARRATGTATQSAGSAAGRSHVVRSGDTLWALARTYRIPVDRLASANRLKSGQVLKIGQRLVIPAS
jgi:membrane-bound lytic murein transglycosylase D